MAAALLRGFNHSPSGASIDRPRQGARRVRVLRAEAISVFRGERLVLSDLSFALAPGEALLLTGPNGSGKSTLLRLLAGLLRPEAGRLWWRDSDALADPAEHAARLMLVGHLDAVKPALTAAENLRLPGGDIAGALAALDLTHLAELPARMLSAGQKRRLALARLALAPAALWLLDEPTLGLDAASVSRFGTMLAAHRARGGMVIAATHLPLPLPEARELRLT